MTAEKMHDCPLFGTAMEARTIVYENGMYWIRGTECGEHAEIKTTLHIVYCPFCGEKLDRNNHG